MTTDNTRESITDLAFAVRRIARWARRAYPAPETEEMLNDVEKRLSGIAARLGSD